MDITIIDLTSLVGKWQGIGYAEYPTIMPMEYREETIFTNNNKDAVIHFEQRTWILSSGNKNNEPIFWESGFLIDKGKGLCEIVSAQKSGRMEILRGTAQRMNDTTIQLPLASVSIHNDERMIRSGRIYTFAKNVLHYELTMSTTANPSYQRHLSGRLTRMDN